MYRFQDHIDCRRLGAHAGPLAVAAACLMLLPAGAIAAPATLHKTYLVKVNRNVLSKGNSVKAAVTVNAPDPKVSFWWNTKSVTTVIRKGVNGSFQVPYNSDGFRCSPTVRGNMTSFTCMLRGADVPTTVTVKWAVVYA